MAKKNVPYDQEYYDKEIETMPREQLEELQLGYLKDELKFAYENCPYYKRAWDEAGVSPEIDSLADLQKFPFINKQTERDTQGVGSFFGELCGVPEDEVVYMATSSGSTGVPTMSPFTQGDFEDFMKAESRLFWQAGMRPNDRYLHGMNFALYVGGPCVIGAQELGALGIWVGAVERSPAVGHEAIPAHLLLVLALLRMAARPEGPREGLRPQDGLRIAQAHHHLGRAGWLHRVDAQGHRGDLGRERLRLLRPVRHLRRLRRHVRCQGWPAHYRGPDPRRGRRPGDRRGASP